MDRTSVTGTSGGRNDAASTMPACVAGRATDLLELASLKLLALCLGAIASLALASLGFSLLLPPHLHYIPGVR